MTFKYKNNLSGFTLVELLIVIVLIGILSGVAISTLNPTQQRLTAEDGVKRSNLSKIVDAVEAYNGGETSYPLTGDFCNATSVFSKTYMAKCPNGEPNGATYTYSSNGTSFGVVVAKSFQASATQCIKYRSSWLKPQDCTNCDAASDTCTGVAAPVPTWTPYTGTTTSCDAFCQSLGSGRTCTAGCPMDGICSGSSTPYGFEAYGGAVPCAPNFCSFNPQAMGASYTTKKCCCQ